MYGGHGGRGRPGFVAPKQQLQYTIYRVLSSTAVQQYSSTTETAVQQPFTPHTPSGGRRITKEWKKNGAYTPDCKRLLYTR